MLTVTNTTRDQIPLGSFYVHCYVLFVAVTNEILILISVFSYSATLTSNQIVSIADRDNTRHNLWMMEYLMSMLKPSIEELGSVYWEENRYLQVKGGNICKVELYSERSPFMIATSIERKLSVFPLIFYCASSTTLFFSVNVTKS